MAISYGKATYSQLIDDVRYDLNDDAKLTGFTDEAAQHQILRAEARICELIEVAEEYDLRVTDEVDEYSFQDRPPITDITETSPRTITAAGHGLVVGDIIYIRDVQGDANANGHWYVSYMLGDSFKIRQFARVTDASNESPIEISAEDHGFSDGDSIDITGVLGNTAANGSWTITYIDEDTFSLDTSTGNGAYTSGGFALKDNLGAGYTSGGRFWKEGELPTYLWQVKGGHRIYTSKHMVVRAVSMETIEERQTLDWYAAYTGYSAPDLMAVTQKNGIKYLKLFPVPVMDEYMTVWAHMRVEPIHYQSDPLTATIHLSGEFNDMIRWWLKSAMYYFIKEYKLAEAARLEFYRVVDEYKRHMPALRRRAVVYT